MPNTETERPAVDEAQGRFAAEAGPHPDLWPNLEEGGVRSFDKEAGEYVDGLEMEDRDKAAFSGHERIGKVRAIADPPRRGGFIDELNERLEAETKPATTTKKKEEAKTSS